MDIVTMQSITILLFIIETFFQIYLLNKFKKKDNTKSWYLFLGFIIASFPTTIFYYIYNAQNSIGLSTAIVTLFIFFSIPIVNLALLIAGIIIKTKKKRNGIRSDKITSKLYILITFVLISALNIGFLFGFPLLSEKIIEYQGGNFVSEYLVLKYGNHDFEVVDVNIRYSNYGMFDKTMSGYTFKFKSNCTKNNFTISTDERFKYVESDNFLPIYYSETLGLTTTDSYGYDFSPFEQYIINERNIEDFVIEDISDNYIVSWSNIEGVKYSSNYYIVPDNTGRILTINEFVDALNEFYDKN